jgi:hypothetical protein
MMMMQVMKACLRPRKKLSLMTAVLTPALMRTFQLVMRYNLVLAVMAL